VRRFVDIRVFTGRLESATSSHFYSDPIRLRTSADKQTYCKYRKLVQNPTPPAAPKERRLLPVWKDLTGMLTVSDAFLTGPTPTKPV